MLVLRRRENLSTPEKNLSEQRRAGTNNKQTVTASIQDRVMIEDFFQTSFQHFFFPHSGLSNRCRDQYRPLKKQDQSFFQSALQAYTEALVVALKKTQELLPLFQILSLFSRLFPEV